MSKICPFLSKECIKENCVSWDNDYCSMFQYFKDSNLQRSEYVKDYEEVPLSEEIIEYFKKEDIKIACDIAQYIIDKGYKEDNLNRRIKNEFWNFKGLDMNKLSYDIELRIDEINYLVDGQYSFMRLPKELQSTSSNDISDFFYNWLIENNPEHLYELRNAFPFHTDLPNDHCDVIENGYSKAVEKFEVYKNEKLKDIAMGLVDELVLFCKKKDYKKVTKNGVKLFLHEKKVKLPPLFRDMMYDEANTKF